jgi:hypothetical protein
MNVVGAGIGDKRICFCPIPFALLGLDALPHRKAAQPSYAGLIEQRIEFRIVPQPFGPSGNPPWAGIVARILWAGIDILRRTRRGHWRLAFGACLEFAEIAMIASDKAKPMRASLPIEGSAATARSSGPFAAGTKPANAAGFVGLIIVNISTRKMLSLYA